MIRLFEPTLGQDELTAVAEVFADSWPGPGERVRAFEQQFADFIGANPSEVMAITCCTEGLFQAVSALAPCKRAEIVMPTISFVGAAHAVRAAGARLRLVDVDSSTLNPNPDAIDAAITVDTVAILLLHFGGRLESIKEIATLARDRGVTLIEDAACGLGGSANGVSFGCFGEIGVWSFDAMKLLVTGDGGLIRVRDKHLRQRVFNRMHLGGARAGREAVASQKRCWWEVDPPDWGRMAFMNDLAATIGLVQLERIGSFVERRWRIVHTYNRELADIPWISLSPPPPSGSVPYFYWIQTDPGIRDRLALHLLDCGVYSSFRYWPLHRMSLYADDGWFPGADRAATTTLLLPLHQNLSESDTGRVIESVRKFRG